MELYIKPISWSIVNPSAKAVKNDPSLFSAIQIFGYTKEGNSIYIRIPKQSTFIIKFNDNMKDEILSYIKETLNPTVIKASNINLNILIVRTSEIPNNESIDIKQDPYGELESFWEIKEIGPYEWLKIDNYTPLPGKYTSCDLNIRTNEKNISHIDNFYTQNLKFNVFFWNIETTDKEITTISILIQNKFGTHSYIIIRDNIIKFNDSFIKVNNEKDLLIKFFEIYDAYKSDYMIYYHSNTLDILLQRLNINDLEITKIINHKPETIELFGTQIIDLLHYYKKFYPFIKSNKLDTISNYFIDKKDLKNISLMYELWNINKIIFNIEHICNNLGISINCILRDSYEDIMNRTIYNIDPGIHDITYKEPNYLKEAIKGIYQNIYVYDYSELYRQILLSSTENITSTLGERLENSPSKIIVTGFYASCIYNDYNQVILKSTLDDILITNKIISIEPFIIRSIGPLKKNWLKYIENVDCYIPVSNKSSISLIDNNIDFYGVSPLCRPKFKLLENIMTNYMELLVDDKLKHFKLPLLENIKLENFVMTEKITDSDFLSSDTIKYSLSKQYCEQIITPVNVKYIMTTKGPILLSKFTKNYEIDQSYYLAEINKQLSQLKCLKVYNNK